MPLQAELKEAGLCSNNVVKGACVEACGTGPESTPAHAGCRHRKLSKSVFRTIEKFVVKLDKDGLRCNSDHDIITSTTVTSTTTTTTYVPQECFGAAESAMCGSVLTQPECTTLFNGAAPVSALCPVMCGTCTSTTTTTTATTTTTTAAATTPAASLGNYAAAVAGSKGLYKKGTGLCLVPISQPTVQLLSPLQLANNHPSLQLKDDPAPDVACVLLSVSFLLFVLFFILSC